MEGERECHMGVGIFTDDQEGLIELAQSEERVTSRSMTSWTHLIE